MGKQSDLRRRWEATLDRGFLLQHLRYEPDTGHFFWLQKGGAARKMGVPAGSVSSNGYVQICFKRRFWSAHRLAWFIHYGTWPVDDLDHINRVRTDNRICNLRPATRSQNAANTKPRGNVTGLMGVTLDRRSGRYYASIGIDYKTRHLGTFKTPEEAHQVYLAAKSELHPEFSGGV